LSAAADGFGDGRAAAAGASDSAAWSVESVISGDAAAFESRLAFDARDETDRGASDSDSEGASSRAGNDAMGAAGRAAAAAAGAGAARASPRLAPQTKV
jgi:hypothetical protein